MGKRALSNTARGGFEHIYRELERLDKLLASIAPENQPLGNKATIQARTLRVRLAVSRMQVSILQIHPTANNGLLSAVSNE